MSGLLAVLLGLLLSIPALAEELVWAGCSITKGACMAELAKAYETKTGTRIVLLSGGRATKGIRTGGREKSALAAPAVI